MRRSFLPIVVLLAGGCHDWESLSTGYGQAKPSACVAYVVAGDTHSCARRTNGQLDCWGDNRFGQLGTGDTVKRATPSKIDVAGLGVSKVYLPTGSGEISADRAVFTCVGATDNSLFCWGDNRSGQLGSGDLDAHLKPTRVEALGANVARAANGAGHACAQTSDGALHCWGSNAQGQLGVGTTQAEPTPKKVVKLADVVGVSCGGAHTCAKRGDSTLWCWGSNQQGQLGVASNETKLEPAQVTALGARVERLSAGPSHTCAFTNDGVVWCWGDNRFGQLGTGDTNARTAPEQVKGLGAVTQVFAGGTHTCALGADGALSCWGGNRFGQLGTGDTSPRNLPSKVEALGNQVAAAYAGGAHTCAVKTDGSLWCWGSNQYGQLGAGSTAQSATPLQVEPACP